MFCPACGTESNEQTKYCTKCGVNLRRVKGVLGKGGATRTDPVDWQRATAEDWLEERNHQRRKSPEEKRLNEIKAGVITTSVGLGILIFLSLLFAAIAQTVEGPERQIMYAIPFAGLIPVLIGLGLIVNGVFVTKRLVKLKEDQQRDALPASLFSAPDTSPVQQLNAPAQPVANDFSVVEPTTTRLAERISAPSSRDTN
ncbi:MAG: hypothetical protein U0X75_14560 [Acidobacteriota bacterium]